MKQLIETYEKRYQTFEATANILKAKYGRFAIVRLLLFIVAFGLSIYLFSVHLLAGAGFLLVFLPAFYRFMLWHQRIQQSEQHHRQLSNINYSEIEALDGNSTMYYSGEPYQDALHPYTFDLDVFGSFSLFQYISRCGTALGAQQLAQYLSQPANKTAISERQIAIKDLSPQLDWRQDLQAYSFDASDALHDIQMLESWLQQPEFVRSSKWLKFALFFTPVWVATGAVLLFFGLHWSIALLFLLLPGWILRKTLDQVNDTHRRTAKAEELLLVYARLIQHIEEGSFESKQLDALQNCFKPLNRTASEDIRELSYIISQLNVRYNAFAIFLNLFALWDLHWVYRLERWRHQHKTQLPQWFEALGHFEAISSLANMAYNNPDWAFPDITSQNELNVKELGHPLLHRDKRISNDLQMPTQGHIKLITGSNMAGKSTFLRSVGLNIVLAMAGAPVCAKKMELPELQVYTSMRTQDALHESTSSFYAELKRLKFIIEAVEKGENIFFLLDEILKGTNSNDRHTGSKALIKQLTHSKGGGLIATHDLELGILEQQYDGGIENLCLEVEIENGKLRFDYKVKKGVSQSFNATLLMQEMGIKISELEQEA